MIELIAILILMFSIGAFLYATKYYRKERPKVGIVRENASDYFKDFYNLKLYWVSIVFMFFSTACLIAIIIMEIVFD